jgi:outer membrane lipoprotein carrier protein
MRLSLAIAIVAGILWQQPQAPALAVSAAVRRFENRYRASRTLRATFLERYLDNGKEVRSEAGIAYFSRPGKMRWEYTTPEVNLYVVDGKWTWFYVPADHTVTRIRAKESSDARTPLALLAGEMKVSRICKSVDADSSSRPSEPRGEILRCNLRGSNDGSRPGAALAKDNYALFELDPADGQLVRILVVEPGGVQVEFRFANWEFDPLVEDAKFHFQTPKGVAIVDGDFSGATDASGQEQRR